jgi:hypothetical protein
MYDQYKSAKLISASGRLNKNKGVMVVGVSGAGCQLKVKGLSGGNWIDNTMGITLQGQPFVVVPVPVYGITLGTSAAFELN